MTQATPTLTVFGRSARDIAVHRAAVAAIVAGGERPLRIPLRYECAGKWEALVHRSTVTPGAWQATRFCDDDPVGHTEGTFEHVIATLARDYSADLARAVDA